MKLMRSAFLTAAAMLASSAIALQPANPAPAPGQPTDSGVRPPGGPRPVPRPPANQAPHPAPHQGEQPAGQPPPLPGQVEAPPPPPPPEYKAPTWGSPELEKIGKILTGSWKSSGAVTQRDADAKSEIWMHIKPILVSGMDSTMYVESSRADAPHRPYRQAIFQLYTFKGKPRLRTYEFRARDTSSMTGMWLAPAYFPALDAHELVATLDVELTPAGNGYTGKTPYPYPTAIMGAVEMTSEIQLSDDTLVTKDRGYDASGKVVWPTSESETYTFKKAEAPYKVDTRDNGLVIITLVPGDESGKKIAKGDRVGMHYTGWLSTGRPFDSTRPRNQPLLYNQGGGMAAGLTQGLEGSAKGEIRRIAIPWQLGYGAQGRGAAIPPYSNLIFESEIMSIDTPEAEPASPTAPAEPVQPK